MKSSASSNFPPLHWRNPAIVGLFRIHLHVFVMSLKHPDIILQWQLTSARPKLKFYLFPPYPTDPEKKPLLKNLYFNFQSRIYFFWISLQTLRIVQCKQCYLSRLFVYLIWLPIIGLCSKTYLKQPLKDIHNKGCLDKWALNAGRKYCGSILQYFWPALCDTRSW